MNTPQELLDKVGKLFLSKAKTKKIDIDGEFGKGQIVITGIHAINKYGKNIFLEVNVKYVMIEKKSSFWLSDKKWKNRINDALNIDFSYALVFICHNLYSFNKINFPKKHL
jgi:hypothetical protein